MNERELQTALLIKGTHGETLVRIGTISIEPRKREVPSPGQ
jgi:hypothetical protein